MKDTALKEAHSLYKACNDINTPEVTQIKATYSLSHSKIQGSWYSSEDWPPLSWSWLREGCHWNLRKSRFLTAVMSGIKRDHRQHSQGILIHEVRLASGSTANALWLQRNSSLGNLPLSPARFINTPACAAPPRVPASSSQGQIMCQEDDSQAHSTQLPPMSMALGWDGDSVRSRKLLSQGVKSSTTKISSLLWIDKYSRSGCH